MNNAILVLKYIIKNNPWYEIPGRLFQAVFYQCYKRMTRSITTKTLFNGKQIFLFPKSPISSAFVYSAFPDKEEILLLRECANSDTIFLDIGANIGAYSILLLDKIKKAFAFEPHPTTANYCKLNFLLNGIDPNCVIEKAVSENQDNKYFSNQENGSPVNTLMNEEEGAITVPCISVDHFINQQQFDKNANFIVKIDVEGFEHEVFKGAEQFLKNSDIRAIIFETFSSQNAQILAFLAQLGFQLKPMGKHNMLAYK